MERMKQSLPEKTIHFWYCNFDNNREQLEAYYTLLSKDEKERSSKFKFEKDRECYVLSRGILRCLLGNYLNVKPKDIKFKYTSYGKPLLNFESDLKFNISILATWLPLPFSKIRRLGSTLKE